MHQTQGDVVPDEVEMVEFARGRGRRRVRACDAGVRDADHLGFLRAGRGGAESGCTGTSDSTNGPCLYAKGTGTMSGNPERGLGLIPNSQYEIFSPDGIGLISSAPILSVSIGSVQSGESWQLQGCDFHGACTTLDQGVGGGTNGVITLDHFGSYAAYVVDVPCANSATCSLGSTDSSNNILLMSVTTSVPEPATWALFAAGLAGVGVMLRRRQRSA